jgi:2-dehydro-3-deoxyphosphogluconate aldolase/(4S)-4-hydroxy-2-oxoglutarate aldolase
MARTKEQILKQVADAGVVAVIRAKSKDQLVGLTEALLAGGVPSIEVTMTTPDAIAGIRLLAQKFGDSAAVGVGTVTDAKTAREAIAAGAEYVVSPILNLEIIETVRSLGKIVIPGAFTPTEIFSAWKAGADVVKVFPSTGLGPCYFKDILAPLPMLKLTPTGGVDLKNAGDWIKAGAVFVGAGSSLISKDALANNDWKSVTANAKAFVDVIRAARAK